MTKILNVTATPSSFTSGNFPLNTLQNGPAWTLVWTPASASIAGEFGGFEAIAATNDNGGLWQNARRIELYNGSGSGTLIAQSGLLTWLASTPITITLRFAAGTNASSLTVAGATTGNGTTTFTTSGTYFTATTLGIGQFTNSNTFLLSGTVSSIDDTSPDLAWQVAQPTPWRRARAAAMVVGVIAAPEFTQSAAALPDMSWSPVMPAAQLRRAPRAVIVGGQAAPEATLANPESPLLAWAPSFPDRAVMARQAVIQGGSAGPEATIPNPPAPELSWLSWFPDSARRARGAQIAGGAAQPEATLPSLLPPGLSWASSFPDQLLRKKQLQHDYQAAPPFAGGRSLTTGAAAIRQNILSALTFTGGSLTTFGTDPTVTVDASTDTLTTGAAHGMVLCAGPFFIASSGTFPGNTDGVTPYFVAAPTSTTFKIALTPALAKAGTVVDITSAGTGTITLIRSTATAPLYSTLVAFFARGNQATSPNQATDSAGNTYTYITGTPRPYDSFAGSSASVAVKISARGGSPHTWSASIGNVGGNEDEVVVGGLEIFDAPILQSSSIVERADGSAATIVSGTVTTTARALLVAIIFGNGNVNQNHIFTFLDGFSKVARACAEGDVNAAGYIQVEVATRIVELKGTYSFRAQGTVGSGGPEGGQMVLLAFQQQTSDLQPFDWLFPQPEIPRRHRPRPLGMLSDPIAITAAAVVPLSWSSQTPDAQRPRRSVASATSAEPVSTDQRILWLTASPEIPGRQRRYPDGGEAAPVVFTADVPVLSWQGIFPDVPRARSRGVAGISSAQPETTPGNSSLEWMRDPAMPAVRSRQVSSVEASPVPVVAQLQPLTWLSVWPEPARRPACSPSPEIAAPVVVPPVPVLAWAAVFPDLARRAHAIVAQGGHAGPEAVLPNPPAPVLSWLSCFPDTAPDARPAPNHGGSGEPVLVRPVTFASSPARVHARRVTPRVRARSAGR